VVETFVFTWLLTVLLPVSFVYAQQPKSFHRVGYLANTDGIRKNTEEVFRQGLRELGYIEGQNFAIEWRFSKGKLDRLPELAAELVRLNVDCIVSFGVAPTHAAKQATMTIPIVMGNADDDPVRHGLVDSLGRPGGNVTGFTSIGSDLAGKRLEILNETVPKASRIAILWDPRGPGGAGHAREAKLAAAALAIELQDVEVQRAGELDRAFLIAVKGRAEALMVVHTGLLNTQRDRILDFASRRRLPAMYSNNSWVLDGGLMGYDTDLPARLRGVASYVDRILRGVKPADLPVVQPTKFELAINLKTAKEIGLTIPPNVLARADRVIR
jgi:putative ABC transport system substrate-binding protein